MLNEYLEDKGICFSPNNKRLPTNHHRWSGYEAMTKLGMHA